jgi:hypothetical protein
MEKNIIPSPSPFRCPFRLDLTYGNLRYESAERRNPPSEGLVPGKRTVSSSYFWWWVSRVISLIYRLIISRQTAKQRHYLNGICVFAYRVENPPFSELPRGTDHVAVYVRAYRKRRVVKPIDPTI